MRLQRRGTFLHKSRSFLRNIGFYIVQRFEIKLPVFTFAYVAIAERAVLATVTAEEHVLKPCSSVGLIKNGLSMTCVFAFFAVHKPPHIKL